MSNSSPFSIFGVSRCSQVFKNLVKAFWLKAFLCFFKRTVPRHSSRKVLVTTEDLPSSAEASKKLIADPAYLLSDSYPKFSAARLCSAGMGRLILVLFSWSPEGVLGPIGLLATVPKAHRENLFKICGICKAYNPAAWNIIKIMYEGLL